MSKIREPVTRNAFELESEVEWEHVVLLFLYMGEFVARRGLAPPKKVGGVRVRTPRPFDWIRFRRSPARYRRSWKRRTTRRYSARSFRAPSRAVRKNVEIASVIDFFPKRCDRRVGEGQRVRLIYSLRRRSRRVSSPGRGGDERTHKVSVFIHARHLRRAPFSHSA